MLVELVFCPLTLCGAPSGSDKPVRLLDEVSRVDYDFVRVFHARFLCARGAPETCPPDKLNIKTNGPLR